MRSTMIGSVVLLEVDNPPVNVLSPGVPEAILAAVDEAEGDPRVAAIVLRGAGKTFIVGADLTTLQRAARGELDAAADLHDLLARLEDCEKPIVMAIHGNALGGGLELAMAGHFRVAMSDALLGQPEVNLGIIPGAEGTQRLPRLVGVAKAIEMCVSGTPIGAADALQAGLIDEVLTGDLNEGAIDFAESTAIPRGPRRTREQIEKLQHGPQVFAEARVRASQSRPDEIAPMKAIDALEAAATLPFAEGCRRERELFFEVVQTERARTRIDAFFAARAAKRQSR